ncbi:MAG: response regulator, partial [Bacteroidota bacterium]
MSSQTIDTANHTLPKKNGIKKHTIVYVDDEAHNLSVFKSLFRKLYDVILFVNPIEALDYLRKHDVSILITDQQMPEMKGTELIESITKEKEDLITIILTGYSDVKVIKDAINRCNINCFITKPFDFDEMEAELDSQILVLELKKEKEDLIKQIQSNNFQLESEVSKRKEELAATNERLFEGLRYAKKIQKSILSDRRILKDVFSDVMIFYKPLDIVSGDFYFFKRIGNKVIIAAFDCTGHGVPGAILSM